MFKNIYNVLDELLMIFEVNGSHENSSALFDLSLGNSNRAKTYLTAIYFDMVKLIQEAKPNFKVLFENDIKILLENNKLPRVNFAEFKNVPKRKEYQEIQEYEHIFKNRTESKTKSTIVPKCDGICCEHFQDLGPLNLEKGKWDSKCQDRMMNVECNPDICGCDREKCKNMAILNKKSKILGSDVIEKHSWGIDLYTYRNLIEFLPLNFSDELKSKKFIEKTLIKACCHIDFKGYSLKKACKYIIHSFQENQDQLHGNIFSKIEIFFAKHLLDVFSQSKVAKSSSHAYSKGIGIFCLKKDGIKKNELIAPYLGEIYPPWYWYEKQDLIKKKKLDKVLPDFYNIMLERHKTDSKGYDLVMVDPNSKGNFASRMSHSCRPNCNTVLMSSGKEYTIGMYATEDITYGEELTFDYNSVTEKEKEFQDAICLCSSFNCRGHYLIYSNSNLFTEILPDHHTFLHRNSILLKACDNNFELNYQEELTQPDKDLLDKYAIRSSILEKAPFWLRKWAALILRYVDFESKQLPILLSKNFNSIEKDDIKDTNKEGDLIKNESFKNGTKINHIRDEEVKKIDENIRTNSRKDIEKSSFKKVAKTKESNSIQNNTKIKYDFNDNFVFQNKKYFSSRRKTSNKNETNESNHLSKISTKEKEKKETLEEIEELKPPLSLNSNNLEIEKIEESLDKMDVVNKNSFNNENYINGSSNQLADIIIVNNHLRHEKENYIQDTAELPSTKPLISNDEINLRAFSIEVASITESRIQNIAITIDKVIHVLQLMKTNKPPLIKISENEIYEHYWGKSDSIRENLFKNFKKVLKCPDFHSISTDLLTNVENIIKLLEINFTSDKTKDSKHDYASYNAQVREKLKEISFICMRCIKLDKSNKFIFYEGLADILFLYSSTSVYFKHDNSYGAGAESELSYIRRRDICTTSTGQDLDEAIHKDRKHYDKLYIWGQLVGWFKQTVRVLTKLI